MSLIIQGVELAVKGKPVSTRVLPVDLTVNEMSGIPFAAEDETPYSFKAGIVDLTIPEDDTIDSLLTHDEVEFYIYINDELVFVGRDKAPYAFSEDNLGRDYNIAAKSRVINKALDIIDSRTNGNYPYIFAHTAVDLILDEAGVPADDRIINPVTLSLDNPVAQIINRATADLAESDISYTVSRKVSNPVKIGNYVYLGIGEYIVAYYNYIWYRVARFGSTVSVYGLAVDGSDLVARLFYDDTVHDLTFTPAPSRTEWPEISGSFTSSNFYADGYEIEAKGTRWKTYGAETADPPPDDNTAYFAIQAIGHAPPTSTKESGVPDIYPRGEGELQQDAAAEVYTIYVDSDISDPHDVGLDIGNLIAITGHNAEHLGEILNVAYNVGFYLVLIEKRTEHFHGEGESVHWYKPGDFMTPNILLTRYDKLHIRYENENEIGGRYGIKPPKAVKRIDDEDIINEFYKPISVDTEDKDIAIPSPGWYAFISESTLEVLDDHFFADLPRKFYIDVPAPTRVSRDADWRFTHPELERWREIPYTNIDRGGTTVATCKGRAEVDGEYLVYEDYLYDSFQNVITNVTFNRWDGSVLRMLYRYRRNTTPEDYEGKAELLLTGNIKYDGGKVYGVGKTIDRSFAPLHSRIIGAANPRDADEEIPDDANTKGITIIVMEGDLTDWLEAGKVVKIGDSTSEEPGGREYSIIEVDAGPRQFVQQRVMTRNDIRFYDEEPLDYIKTVDGNFKGKFQVDEWVTISGSANNDGRYQIASVAGKRLAFYTGDIVDEAAGAEVTITGGDNDLVKCDTQEWQFDEGWDGNIGDETFYSGYVTWAMIMPYGGTEPKADFCGRYVWFERRRIERPCLFYYDTNAGTFTINEMTLDTEYPKEVSERQEREREGTKGVELDEVDTDWIYGPVYRLPDNDVDLSSVRAWFGTRELTVEDLTGEDIPKPPEGTIYISDYKGPDANEIWVYSLDKITCSYDYYPDIELSAVFVYDNIVYVAGSDGFIYDSSFTPIVYSTEKIVDVYEDDDVYFTTENGLFGVFNKTPPAVAEDFGGDITAVTALGDLTRQSITTLFEYGGKFYFGTDTLDDDATWALNTINADDSMPPVAVEVDGVRAGDVKALDVIDTFNAPYTRLNEQIAEAIYEKARDRRIVILTGAAEEPYHVIGVVSSRGTTYRILSLNINKNELYMEAEVLEGIKAGRI